MSHNLDWAQAIIDTLYQNQVTQFFLAPGTRSAPFAITLASHPHVQTTVHFDERGLAFHALGYTKASKKPAVIIVTSGTAVGNLLPAIMEADQSQIPLIILSADRPEEELDIGANQTCDQIKLFTNFVRFEAFLPSPDPSLSSYLISTIQQAVSMSQGELRGPVHINCAFKDPRKEQRNTPVRETFSPSFTRGKLIVQEKEIGDWVKRLSQTGPGIILVGDGCTGMTSAALLAETLGWPLIADVLGEDRLSPSSTLISHYDLILQSNPELSIDRVIQFGNRFVSRTLFLWLKKQKLNYYLHVSDHPHRQDPHHLISNRLQGCPSTFIRDLVEKLPKTTSSHLSEWQQHEERCSKVISSFFSKATLSEPALTIELANLNQNGFALFIGNSLPIRDCNALFGTAQRAPLFGNRGVSGIDGNIATALGIAKAIQMPMIAFLGDLTSLHDLNSLALLQSTKSPFILVVTNNQGGGIFSSLPLAEHTEHLSAFFTHSHCWDFSHAAALFGIPYLSIRDLSSLKEFCQMQKVQPQSYLLEVHTDIQHNISVREQILEALCLTSKEEPLLLPL